MCVCVCVCLCAYVRMYVRKREGIINNALKTLPSVHPNITSLYYKLEKGAINITIIELFCSL